MSKCVVCGESTDKPIASALSHFKLYQSGMWRYLRGNSTMFGWRQGLWSTVCLAFPFISTVAYWRHRKSRLQLPSDFKDTTP